MLYADEGGQVLEYFQEFNALQISLFRLKIHKNSKDFVKELILYLRRELHTNTIAFN